MRSIRVKSKQQSETRPRKRWIVIGPGLVLALIISIQIVIANREKPAAPPIVERQVVGSEMPRRFVPTPEVKYLLARKEQLALSTEQVQALDALQTGWQGKSKPLTDDLKKAAGEFDAYMKGAGERASLRDLQSHAGDLSELSREVSSLRRIYWEKAVQVLNKDQRKAIEKELSHSEQAYI
jgi:hypothetical protein